jgi:hypothetical protein
VSGTWAWTGVAWSTDRHLNEPFWDEFQDQYVPLGSNLQRIIVRDGNYVWAEVANVASFPRFAGGVMTTVVLVGTDGGGLQPVETQHKPVIITSVIDRPVSGQQNGYYWGYVPNVDIDLDVRRTNGVDRDTQTHVQVHRIFNSPAFQASQSFPEVYGAGELLYLSHVP